MKKKRTFFLFLTVVFIFLSVLAFAQSSEEKKMVKKRFHVLAREVMDELKLTEKQQADLHALREELKDEAISTWKKVDELQIKLRESVLKGAESSGEAHNEIINKIAELKARMVKNRLEYWIKFVEILDSSQRETLADRLKELREKRPKRGSHLRGYFPFP